MNAVCLDAGLIVKLVTLEPDSPQVEAAFQKWKGQGVDLVAPAFAAAEVDSVLRQKVLRGDLTEELADAAFRLASQLPIGLDLALDCRWRAWEIARVFTFPTVYDAVYLALAEMRQCEFWTADRRLYERVKEQLAFVRLLTG